MDSSILAPSSASSSSSSSSSSFLSSSSSSAKQPILQIHGGGIIVIFLLLVLVLGLGGSLHSSSRCLEVLYWSSCSHVTTSGRSNHYAIVAQSQPRPSNDLKRRSYHAWLGTKKEEEEEEKEVEVEVEEEEERFEDRLFNRYAKSNAKEERRMDVPNARKLGLDSAPIPVPNPTVIEPTLLTLEGNLLESSPCPRCYIRALSLSSDDSTVYFAEEEGVNISSVIRQAVLDVFSPSSSSSPSPSSSSSSSFSSSSSASYIVSNVTQRTADNTHWTAFASLDRNGSETLLATAITNLIYEVDVRDYGNRRDFIAIGGGPTYGFVRHPTQPVLFVAVDNRRILKVPMAEGAVLESFANLLAGGDKKGKQDGSTGSQARFSSPRLHGRCVSSDGSYLYVADQDNSRIVRVDTLTGATYTLFHTDSPPPPPPPPPPSSSSSSSSFDASGLWAIRYKPSTTAITKDNCNLFFTGTGVPDGIPTVIHWMTFREPHGQVLSVNAVVLQNTSTVNVNLTAFPRKDYPFGSGINQGARLMLSSDDSRLYMGTGNGEIFAFRVNRSALYNCTGGGSLAHATRYGVSLAAVVSGSVAVAIAVVVCLVLLIWVAKRKKMLCWRRGDDTWGRDPSAARQIDKAIPTSTQDTSLLSTSAAATSSITSVLSRFCSSSSAASDVGGDGGGRAKVRGRDRDHRQRLQLRGEVSAMTRDLGGLDTPRPIPFSVLEKATDGFHRRFRVVGARGGFGDVYRASLPAIAGSSEKVLVAIKVMRGDLNQVKRKQFLAEVKTLSCARHAHLCKLSGYCVERGSVILVYPFISGGSLFDRLHRRRRGGAKQLHAGVTSSAIAAGTAAPNRCPPVLPLPPSPAPPPPPRPDHLVLNWRSRVHVAQQIGIALRYLHEELDPPLLHRDVKSSNVLVEGTGEHVRAYLADFGLARLGNPSLRGERGRETVKTNYRAGTIGYMAPEYAIGLKLTAKNDVYAFGVILLEIVTGKKALFWSSKPSRYDGGNADVHEAEEEEEEEEEGEEDVDEGEEEVENEEEEGEEGRYVGSAVDDDEPVVLAEWCGERVQSAPFLDTDTWNEVVDRQLRRCFAENGCSDWERVSLCGIFKLGCDCTLQDATLRPTMGSVVERIKAIMGDGRVEEEGVAAGSRPHRQTPSSGSDVAS
ncbi:hypothetical protein CBR_g16856 [Chara braunii]|uniref:non-specific serine/threonine protein kinase n=1 Tax=Chara braunii TaxID=69332 RepID=A0A388KU91_CHABU|nr:hypothetical protein CBR_g16856 [Chara braunii]|eukprot:GBG73513.1 hypothetical protein CBR_g16856 [Chara braunii]